MMEIDSVGMARLFAPQSVATRIADVLTALRNDIRIVRAQAETIVRRLDVMETKLSLMMHPDSESWNESHWSSDLECSTRLYNVLHASVRDMEHFKELVESGDLLLLPNVGKVTMAEAREIVAKMRS